MDTDPHIEQDDELYEHFRLTVDKGQSPIRIDKFLSDRLERATRNKVQNAIKAGSVMVNEQAVKSNYKIKPNDEISIVMPKPPREKGVRPEHIPLDIRYEDEELLILHKPPGLVVHPGIGNHHGTLVNGLAYYFQDLPIMKGNQSDRPGLVHRIDKNTSGLMVIAKTEFAMTHLAKQFYDHSIHRTYQAITWSEPDPYEGTIKTNIGRHPTKRIARTAFPLDEEGKLAITHYKMLEPLYYISLIECKLETGRTHQIRVHMQSIGCSLFNDELYGGDRILKGTVFSKYRTFVENCFKLMPRHALHAKSIGFVHPATNKEVFFESELPEDMQAVLERWRTYTQAQLNKKG
ncbi:MAG: RluA family pseudouridine synthase [Bacteroidota bacterium]